MARPSSLTADRRDAIERALAAGASLNVAAASAGVSRRTVSSWLRDGLVVRRNLRSVPEQPVDGAGLPQDDDAIQRALLGAVLRAAQVDWKGRGVAALEAVA